MCSCMQVCMHFIRSHIQLTIDNSKPRECHEDERGETTEGTGYYS